MLVEVDGGSNCVVFPPLRSLRPLWLAAFLTRWRPEGDSPRRIPTRHALADKQPVAPCQGTGFDGETLDALFESGLGAMWE